MDKQYRPRSSVRYRNFTDWDHLISRIGITDFLDWDHLISSDSSKTLSLRLLTRLQYGFGVHCRAARARSPTPETLPTEPGRQRRHATRPIASPRQGPRMGSSSPVAGVD